MTNISESTTSFSQSKPSTSIESVIIDAPFIVTLDTCVLMHSFTRHLLLHLANKKILFPIWHEEIGIEWLRNAPRIWKVEKNIVEELWQDMNKNYPFSHLSVINMDSDILKKIDKKDRHVALCAFTGAHHHPQKNNILLTWNIKDFHRKTLREQNIALQTPDQLLSLLWSTHQAILEEVVGISYQEYLLLIQIELPLQDLLKRDKLYRFAKLVSTSDLFKSLDKKPL